MKCEVHGIEMYQYAGDWYCPLCDEKPDVQDEEERINGYIG